MGISKEDVEALRQQIAEIDALRLKLGLGALAAAPGENASIAKVAAGKSSEAVCESAELLAAATLPLADKLQ